MRLSIVTTSVRLLILDKSLDKCPNGPGRRRLANHKL